MYIIGLSAFAEKDTDLDHVIATQIKLSHLEGIVRTKDCCLMKVRVMVLAEQQPSAECTAYFV